MFDKEVMDQMIRMGWPQNDAIGFVTQLHNNGIFYPNQQHRTPKFVLNEEKNLNGSLKDLIKVKRHQINLMLMFFIWIASSFSLSLLNFEMKYLSGNFFLSNLISGVLDVPVALIGGLLYHKAGIRLVLCLFFLVSFFGGIALIIFS